MQNTHTFIFEERFLIYSFINLFLCQASCTYDTLIISDYSWPYHETVQQKKNREIAGYRMSSDVSAAWSEISITHTSLRNDG